MSRLDLRTFAGWQPDADALGGAPTALLRGDNLTLDEQGVLALRPGSAKINAGALASTDVHSLFTGLLNGTRYRLAGATNEVYANGTSILSGIAGTGDIAFGSAFGQLLMARSTTKRKYDGTTVRNLGIAMTGAAPTIAAVTADTEVLQSCDTGEAGAFTQNEGTAAFVADAGGAANAATELTPDATTGRAVRSKRFAADNDFSSYPGGTTATDDDLVSLYIYLAEPANLESLELAIDVNSASAVAFQSDYYYFRWTTQAEVDLPPPPDIPNFGSEGVDAARVDAAAAADAENPIFRSRIQPVIGWQPLSVRRGFMGRVGSTFGKDWATVRGVRVVATMTGGGAGSAVRIDDIRVTSGAVAGIKKWRYIYVYNTGTYTEKSPPSAASASSAVLSQGVDLTAPADASRDSQANEIWLFRMGGSLDAFYRVAVQTGVAGVGAVTIRDALSDADALTVDIRLETDNAVPPDNIIGIAGPYFDRTCYLTSAGLLYPSRRINPGSCSAGQVIRVAGADETPYWIRKTLGGLYIGTSKDIYRLDGTGAELPDESIDFTLTALNIDHPPISEAVAQEGNLLIYLANDGWRSMAGVGSESLSGATSLLYRGQTRHGVSAVNLTSGRFRGAIAKGFFVAMTPEGASTTSTAVLYRRSMTRGEWMRHPYGSQAWRCVYREPDGTLIASDSAGFVWTLDTGTQDGTTDLAVVLWTPAVDDGAAFVRKDPMDLRVDAITGSATASVAMHLDGSATAAQTTAVALTSVGVTAATMADVAAWRRLQFRVTGSFSVFRLMGLGVSYAALPPVFVGRTPPTDAGYPGLKTMSGIQLRLCTLGAAVTVTPIVDGTDQTTLSVTSAVDDPTDVTHAFTAALEGTELALRVSGDVELYTWSPLITAKRPLGIKAWDSGPLDLGIHDLIWVREVRLKVRAGADLTVTPYFDGVAFEAVTVTVAGTDANTATILSVAVGKGYVGRTPRFVVTSTAAFYPYFIEFIQRQTSAQLRRKPIRVSVALGGEVAA